MATELVDMHLRTTEKRRTRLNRFKTEFGFKSLSKLVNIFIDDGTEKIETKIRFVDKEQGEEIKKIILQIANDIQEIKFNMKKMGTNVNQTAKVANKLNKINLEMLQQQYLESKGIYDKCMAEGSTVRADIEKDRMKRILADINQATSFVNATNLNPDSIRTLSSDMTVASEKLGAELWKLLA